MKAINWQDKAVNPRPTFPAPKLLHHYYVWSSRPTVATIFKTVKLGQLLDFHQSYCSFESIANVQSCPTMTDALKWFYYFSQCFSSPI